MIVEYSKDGIAIPDADAMQFSTEMWQKNLDIKVSSEVVILAFRVLVKKGIIPPYTELFFVYEKQKISIDKRGELDIYPKGFCDTHTNFLFELL